MDEGMNELQPRRGKRHQEGIGPEAKRVPTGLDVNPAFKRAGVKEWGGGAVGGIVDFNDFKLKLDDLATRGGSFGDMAVSIDTFLDKLENAGRTNEKNKVLEEILSKSRPFKQVQAEIRREVALGNTKSQNLDNLLDERLALILVADRVEVFDGLKSPAKVLSQSYFDHPELGLPAFPVNEISTDRVSRSGPTVELAGAEEKLTGMREEYAKVSQESWEWAWQVATGAATRQGTKKDQLRILTWKSPPLEDLVARAQAAKDAKAPPPKGEGDENLVPKLELPADTEGQRRLVREWLREIETIGNPDRIRTDGMVTALRGATYAEQDIKKEVETRIIIWRLALIVGGNKGDFDAVRSKVADLFDPPNNYSFEGGNINYILETARKSTGLNVEQAWNALQFINNPERYKDYCASFRPPITIAFGEGPSKDGVVNYQIDLDVKRRDTVLEAVLSYLDSQDVLPGNKRERSEDAWRVASYLATALFETSEWNLKGVVGDDKLSKAWHLLEWREAKWADGKDHGPDSTVKSISRLGTGIIRNETEGGKILNADVVRARALAMDRGPYMYYCASVLSKIGTAVDNLLKITWTPSDANVSGWGSLFDALNKVKVVGTPKYNLRQLLVWGVMDEIISRPGLGWKPEDYEKFRKAILQTQLTEGKKTFLSESELTVIENAYGASSPRGVLRRRAGGAEEPGKVALDTVGKVVGGVVGEVIKQAGKQLR